MDSLYYICSSTYNFVKRVVGIVVALVIKLARAFVADLTRKVRALTNSDTFAIIMDYLGVIIALVAAIVAMLVSLTVVAIILALVLLPDKRLDGVQGPYVIYTE